MIVVTGAAGFIGSCLLWKFNSEGFDNIIAVDELDISDKQKNLSGKKIADYIDKDNFIKDIDANKNYLKKVKTIVHMGACASTTCTDAAYLTKNNVEYSKVLAKFAILNKKHFLYASSAATYGAGENGYSDDIDVAYKLNPLNMYAFSKQTFDLWVISNNLIDKITAFKFFNVYGPNEYHKGDMRSVVCKGYDEIRKTGKIKLFKSYKKEYKDGEQKRDFVYVKDAVNIVYYFFNHFEKKGIYNVGTSKARTWNDLASSLFESMKVTSKIEYIDMPQELKEKYQYFTEADIAHLRKAGYHDTFTELEDGVKEYVGFLEKNIYL